MRLKYVETKEKLEKIIGVNFYSTDTLGIGGVIKKRLEDFIVVEDSSIQLDPNGQHIMLEIEKRNFSTEEMINHISRHLDIPKKFIGVAGQKDKRSISVQKVSIPFSPSFDPTLVEIKGKLRVLRVERIRRKIRLGMLKGNKFTITLRECSPSDYLIEETLKQVEERGCPNFFGYQRFGITRPNTHLLGKALVERNFGSFLDELLFKIYPKESESSKEGRRLAEEGKYDKALKVMPKVLWIERKVIKLLKKGLRPVGVVKKLGKNLLRFFISAYQSYLFNMFLSKRMELNLPLKNILDCDFVKSKNPAFPLLGYKSKLPGGVCGEIIKDVIDSEGVRQGDFYIKELGIKEKGSLREVVLTFKDFNYKTLSNDTVVLNFWLKKGSYATVLIREFCKNNFYEKI